MPAKATPTPAPIIVPTPEPDYTLAVYATPTPADTPPPALIVVPVPSLLTPAGHELILAFEVGGEQEYKPHPEWPGGSSGVTIGVGYDCGVMARSIVLEDWERLALYDRTRLADTSGAIGLRARARLPSVQDVFVQWGDALDVFDRIDVTRTFGDCKRTFPHFDGIRPNAQAALVSLVFNRGDSMAGPNRVEMRDIRDRGVPQQDYPRIAAQIRGMTHIWQGQDIYNGMKRRREAEAQLVETP